MDHDGHGTHTAGIIGAIGNSGVGVAGITSWVRLLACKFKEGEVGDVQGVIACIKYCVANNATISSNSYRAMLNDTETDRLRVCLSGQTRVLCLVVRSELMPLNSIPTAAAMLICVAKTACTWRIHS